jgi:L-histidine N-alpha-methyltransferase
VLEPLRRVLTPAALRDVLAADVRAGLTATPRTVRSRWLWDERGSELFERITELPDYYLTRAERALLAAHVGDVAAAARADVLVELGSGFSVKTRLLLDALVPRGLERLELVDVSAEALLAGAARLAAAYPALAVQPVLADFERDVPGLGAGSRPLLAVLGSTIGALEPHERAGVLGAAARTIGRHGALLLGLDLVKPVERIVAAYSDGLGLSAALIANLLPVLNRELGADFDPAAFVPEACWVPEHERMEMAVRSIRDQVVAIPGLGLVVGFAEGETLRTEISTKFRREGVERELAAAGLEVAGWWTDDGPDAALCLARQVAWVR